MKILITGDFVPRFRTKEMIEAGDYGFFDEVREYTAKSDYSIINFESPIVNGDGQPIEKAGPNLKCHPNTMKAVRYAGFKCVTLANNHFYDFGDKGVSDTLKACDENDIDHVGGGMNLAEAETVLYKTIGDESLAVVNFCENEWSIATATSGGSAPLNLVHNLRNIQQAKKSADYVLVIVHGGTEHYQLPSPRMKETYRFFVEQGADAVVNHHQHCYSGYEVYQGKPIFYGLGNFCFDKNDPNNHLWNEGYAVEVSFEADGVSFKVLPYSQCSEKPLVHFLDNTVEFDNRLNQLNEIILNDAELIKAFQQMSKTKGFLQFLEPYSNKYLKILKSRGLLPSFLTRKRKNTIKNVFCCEAHRDVMFELLK